MKLGEVIKHRKGFITIDDNKEYKLCRVQVHRKGVVLRGIVKGSEIKTKKQQVCKAGDFLVAEMDAKFGGYGFVPKELDGAIVSSHYFLFELDIKKIRPKYLEVISKLLILQDQIKATGSTNYSAIRPAQVLGWEIPYRDIPSQKEIELLFETTSEKGSILKTELIHQQDLLKKLPQSFLNEAMQGKLVKQDKADGNAADLLKKIKTKQKNEKEFIPVKEEEILFDIPKNWVWCRLGEIAEIVRGGSPRPAGDPTYYGGNIPFLKVGDLTGYEDIYVRTHTYSIKEAGLYKTRFVEADTLMLTNSGATLGVPRICTFPTTFNDGIAAFLNLNFIDKIYLYYFLKSKTDWYLKEASKGQGQPNLNIDIISLTPFPLPPLAEQKRIVKKLEEVLNLCEELKSTITDNQNFTNQLLQVALKDALQMNEVEV